MKDNQAVHKRYLEQQELISLIAKNVTHDTHKWRTADPSRARDQTVKLAEKTTPQKLNSCRK